jgi:hypothetical protein
MSQEFGPPGEESALAKEYGPFCTENAVRRLTKGTVEIDSLIGLPVVAKGGGAQFRVYPVEQFVVERDDTGSVTGLKPREFILEVFNREVRPHLSGTPESEIDALGFLAISRWAESEPTGQGLIDETRRWVSKNFPSSDDN